MEVLAQKIPLQVKFIFTLMVSGWGQGGGISRDGGYSLPCHTRGQLQAARSLEPECKPASLGEELGCLAPPSFSSGRKGLRTT